MLELGKKFPLIEYYKKVIQPINPSHYRIKGDKMLVCPLHDDINPSMGIIVNSKGEEIFHCFGCNSWGNVIDLHKRVSKRLFKRYLSDEDVLRYLCKLFGEDYKEISGVLTDEEKDYDEKVEMGILSAMDRFDIAEYQRLVTDGKLKKKPISYFNTLMMLAIDSMKAQTAE